MNLNLILNFLNLGFLQAPSISDKLYVISSLTKLNNNINTKNVAK